MLEKAFNDYLINVVNGPVNEQRLPVLILVDTSISMSDAMKDVNASINHFIRKVCEDEKAASLIDLCIVTFDDDAEVVMPWTNINKAEVVQLRAGGCTNTTAGLELAEYLLTERGRAYVHHGCLGKKGMLIMLTDGAQTSGKNPDEIIAKIRRRVDDKKMLVSVLAAPGYDKAFVAKLTKGKAVAELHGDSSGFVEAFDFYAISTKAVSLSAPGTTPETPEHTFGDPEKGSHWHKADLKDWLDQD